MGLSARLGRAALAAWLLLPLVPLVLWAAADRWTAPAVLPQAWGTAGLRDAADAGAGAAFLRSTVLGLVVAALATPLGAMAGRALAGQAPAGRAVPAPGAVLAVLLSPLVVPPFVLTFAAPP